MRRHIGSHTHSDTRRSIHEQIRHSCRQHSRLLQSVVEVILKINSLLIQIDKHIFSNTLQPRLGVTHSRRTVAVNRTEVTLPVNKRISHSPLLSQTHHCEINGRVSVRVILTEHLTHDTSRFFSWLVRWNPEFVHTEQHSSVNWLKTVPNIRQCSRHDYRHWIVYVRRAHFLLDVYLNYSVLIYHFFTFFQKNALK